MIRRAALALLAALSLASCGSAAVRVSTMPIDCPPPVSTMPAPAPVVR